MNNFVKKVTSTLLSAVLAATAMLPASINGKLKDADAYSNAQLFVNTAKQLDYISGRPNEATAHYGAPECDWCAMFVHLAASRCGLGNKIPKLAYCDNQYYTDAGYAMEGYRSYYEKRNQFLYANTYLLPEIGDLIIFDSVSSNDGKGDHVGIVINIDTYKGLIYTIEGNGKGDKVTYEKYPYYDSTIIGYCQTNLDSFSETVTPSQPAGPSLPAVDMNNTVSWEVTSSIGCNLRYTPNGDKIGVISTGTILTSNPSKNQGEWIYVKSAVTENGAIHDGYVHCSTVMPSSDKKPVTTTTVTTTVTETTTTTIATATVVSTETDTSESTSTNTSVVNTVAASTTTATAAAAQPQAPSAPENPTTATHYISSLIGANGRTAPEFDEKNISRIIDTDTLLVVNYYKNNFANCTIVDTGETFFIHSSVIAQLPTSEDDYTECARVNYYVSSDCGINLRTGADYDGEILCILDTNQPISVLTSPNELGFVFIEFTFGDGVIHNGYVNIEHITAY